MSVLINETEDKPKAKRAISLFAKIQITNTEIENARFDVVETKKQDVAIELGKLIHNELDIFKATNEENDAKTFTSRLIVANEADYKQMVALINNTLIDSNANEIAIKQVRELLIGLVG